MPDAHHRIAVRSETAYIEEQSSPETNQFVFAYTITIENTGTLPAKLMTRHWIITDANGKVREVQGGRAIRDCHRVPRTEMLGECRLQGSGARSHRQPA